MTFSNHFINARIAGAMSESNLKPVPDYIGNKEDGNRFIEAADQLLKEDEINPKDGTMEAFMLEQQGPVLYRVMLLGLMR